MSTELSRRQLLAWSGGAALLGLTACGNGSPQSGSSVGSESDPTELRFTWWGAAASHERQQGAIDAVTEAAPHLTFRTEFTTGDAYFDRLTTQVAGGNAPDIMSMTWANLTEYAQRGVLEPLDEYSPEYINLEDMDQEFLETGRIDGELYGIGRGATIPSVQIDATMLEEAGIDLPPSDNNWRWEDMAAYATQIHDTVGGEYYGSEDASAEYNTMHVYMRSKGHSLYEGAQLGFPKEALVEWFTLWADMRESGGCVPPNIQVAYNSGLESSPLIRGYSAMLWLNHDTLMNYAGITDHAVVAGLPPLEGTKALFAMPASILCVSAQSEYKAAAAEAVGILVSDLGVSEVYGLESGPPPSQSLVELIRAGELTDAETRVLDYTDLASQYSQQAPPSPPLGSADVASLLTRVSEDIAFGRVDIGTGVDTFFTEAGRALSA